MVGLVYLAAYVTERGHDVSILDANFHTMSEGELRSAIAGCDADVVGITAMTPEIPNVRTILRWIKQSRKDVWTVLGGPHASARPTQTLEEIDDLDFCVSGEGERPLSELLDRLQAGSRSYESVAGLVFRVGPRVVQNTPQTGFLDLTTIPQPAVHLYYEPGFFARNPDYSYYISCCRGCPFHCAFCSKALGRTVRWRSAEAIAEEWIRAVNEYGASRIKVVDEIFLYDKGIVHAIFARLHEEGIPGKARFSVNSHVNLITKAVVRKAKEAGCDQISIGIESGNNDVLREIGRPYTIEKAYQAVRLLREEGIRVHSFFIIGHPGESRRTVIDTLRASVRMDSSEIGLGVMVPYPGTAIYEMAKENRRGYRLTKVDWDGYDRYGCTAVEFEGLRRWEVVLYQVLGYVLFYLTRGRLGDMSKYFRPRIRSAMRAVIRSMMPRLT